MESGKGEPLILVHSAGQSLYTFRRLFYKLAMYYRVIAVDLVGHGYSDRPDFFDYTIGDHAESLARFMDSMGIESAHIPSVRGTRLSLRTSILSVSERLSQSAPAV